MIIRKLLTLLRHWLNDGSPNYNNGKNIVSIANPLYIESVRQLINEGRTVEIPVRGWSMRIFVEHERDKAILVPCDIERLKVGDVILAEVAEKVYALHRIVRLDGDNITMRGDGNLAGTEECTRQDVVAFVTGFKRKGRSTPDLVTSRKWRVYSWFWTRTVPVRRYLILVWRILKKLHIVS